MEAWKWQTLPLNPEAAQLIVAKVKQLISAFIICAGENLPSLPLPPHVTKV